MLHLSNSLVRHFWFGVAKNKEYVEGVLNNVIGHVTDNNRLFLNYTNSHGHPTTAVGKAWIFGPLVFVYATAYGYKSAPDGVLLGTIGWKTSKYIRLAAPIAINELLVVRIEHNKTT